MELLDLWLPILLSAVFVFIASSILHMFIPIHKNDCKALPNEDAALDAIRASNPAPGEYMFPHCADMKEMASEEMTAKYARGPVGFMIISPTGTPSMGKPLTQWFLLCIATSLLCGLLGSMTMMAGAEFGTVMKFMTIASFGMYGMSSVTNSIWKCVPWNTTMKFLFDGLVYALVTGASFAWLWPDLTL